MYYIPFPSIRPVQRTVFYTARQGGMRLVLHGRSTQHATILYCPLPEAGSAARSGPSGPSGERPATATIPHNTEILAYCRYVGMCSVLPPACCISPSCVLCVPCAYLYYMCEYSMCVCQSQYRFTVRALRRAYLLRLPLPYNIFRCM
jgi:hypothetical protein